MNNNILPASEDIVSGQESVAQISGGEMLRRARDAVGLHIAALAVLLKVPVKKLEALEADRFDLLPDTVFVRALAASVCRTLKIDPTPVLERLPHTTGSGLKTDESGINTPFRTSSDGLNLSFLNQLSKPFALAVLVLLVGVLVLVFLPFKQLTEVANVLKSDAVAADLPLHAPIPAPVASEHVAIADGVASTQAPASLPSGLTAPLATNPASSTSVPITVSGALPGLVAGSGATTGQVVLKAHRSSWIEVVDASGIVQVRKTMADGEIVAASGVMPLSVVVGRVDAMEVQVHGKPFDLTGFAKDNVAHFEVK